MTAENSPLIIPRLYRYMYIVIDLTLDISSKCHMHVDFYYLIICLKEVLFLNMAGSLFHLLN